MTKLLKLTGMLLGLIIMLLLIAIISLVMFVSPDRFKPTLVEQVKKHTGRDLAIDGDLAWSFFPYLGVKSGHMSLSNPDGFSDKTFIEFNSATVGVKLMPLFHGRIESSGVTLKGMKLTLIKKADGKVNWAFQKSAGNAGSDNSDAGQKRMSGGVGLAISAVDVEDASVNWIDEQSKQNITVTHFNFNAKDISLTKPIPVATSFDFAMSNPAVSGHAELTSNAAFNLDKQIYSLRDLDFTVQTHKTDKKINLHVTGDVAADLGEQTLQWTNFKASMADLNLSGKVSVLQLMSAPQASGHFDIQPFNLKSLLQNLGQDNANLQVAKDVTGKVDFSASAKAIEANGNIDINELQAAKIKLNHFNAHLNYQNGALTLSPVKADLYQGNLNADAHVSLNTAIPQITLQGKLANVQAQPLMQDLMGANQKLKLTGIANIDLNVKTAGKDGDAIVKNLNGTSHLSFSNGTLEGADLGYLIDSAYALVNRETMSATNTDKTSFGTLTATAVIHDGVVSNNDLLLSSPRFDTKGNGTINLVSQTIDYSLQAALKQNQVRTVKNFSGFTIPIRITGPLAGPSVRVDSSELVKIAAQQQIEKHKEQIQQKVQEKIQENLKGKLPEQAGQLIQNLLGH